MKILRCMAIAILAIVLLAAFAWAVGALYYDGPARWLAAVQAVAIVTVFGCIRRWWPKLAIFGGWFALVLTWWLALKPTNLGDWQPDVAQLAWAEVNGDEVTLHNVRNCEYRSEEDFTPHWETRQLRLSHLTGIDIAVTYWGSPWMAHPILSFQFSDAAPLCFSIETRKQAGQSYSAIGGLYRQFELIYIAADERDVIRLRSNFRKDEQVYLYHSVATPAEARLRLGEYLSALNDLRANPRWYNAITTNCTTAIRQQHPAGERMPWDWRLLVNGKADELMYENRSIATGGLPFAELKRRALINPAARAANQAPDFSARIREGRPGLLPAVK